MRSDFRVKYHEFKENWRQLFLALFIGLIGALIFAYLRFPLPWLLGALFTNTCVTLMGCKIWVPGWLRATSLLILGALFGSSISANFLTNFVTWLPSMCAMIAYVILVMPPSLFYLKKIAGLDPVTAYFASAPGGLLPMTLLSETMGGDTKSVSLIQSSRIVLTVAIVPLAFTIFADYTPSGIVGTGGTFARLEFFGSFALIGVSIVGYLIARPLKIPTPALMGPMAAVALLSMSGSVEAEVPDSLVAIAQCVIGSSIGAMFNNVKLKVVMKTLTHGCIISVFMISFATVSAYLVHLLIDAPTNALILAFAPGGFAEMALVGFALGIDIGFLVTHQITRYIFVITGVPLLFVMLKNRKNIP